MENEFVPTIDCIRRGIRFKKAGKRMVFETWISVNAAALNVHEAAHDLEGLNDEICGGAGMVEEEVELDVVERTLRRIFGSWGAV